MPKRMVFDRWLVLLALTLVTGGLLMVGSASSYIAMQHSGNPSSFLVRHLIYVFLGLGLFITLLSVRYRSLESRPLVWTMLLVCLASLIVVLTMPRIGGALVNRVTDGSPADKAGLETEDVITGINGEVITRSAQLQQKIAQLRPGDQVDLEVYRDRRPIMIAVRLGEAPILRQPEPEAPVVAESRTSDRLGLEIQELTPTLAAELGFEDASGVVVANVRRFGPAFRRQIQPGLKVLEINQVPVKDMDDVRVVDVPIDPYLCHLRGVALFVESIVGFEPDIKVRDGMLDVHERGWNLWSVFLGRSHLGLFGCRLVAGTGCGNQCNDEQHNGRKSQGEGACHGTELDELELYELPRPATGASLSTI